MQIKNKKGLEDILMKEVMLIIISILVILILMYLGFKLYTIFQTQTQTEQAKKTLEEMTIKMEALKEGEEFSFLYLGPKKWYMFDAIKDGNIKECVTDHCLCLCDDIDCDEANICRKTNTTTKFLDDEIYVITFGKIEVPKEYIINKTVDYIIKVKNEE